MAATCWFPVATVTLWVTGFISRAETIAPQDVTRIAAGFCLDCRSPPHPPFVASGWVRSRLGGWVKYASIAAAEALVLKEPGYQLSLTFCRFRRYPGATSRTN
jgi:hypothetical protein